MFSCSEDMTITTSLSTMQYRGSVTFDSGKYLKLGTSYVREDTVANKVFIKYFDHITGTLDSADRILYDYNWKSGDTANRFISDDSHISWVTGVDSTRINGIWYKVWSLESSDSESHHFIGNSFNNIIEGIGCTNGLLYPLYPYSPFENSDQLVCFQNNGNAYPLSNSVSSWGLLGNIYFDDSVSCSLPALGLQKVANNNGALVVSPNPITGSSKITLSYTISAGSLVISNYLGQLILNTTFQNKDKLLIGDKINTPGMYFYRASDNESGQVFSGKFIYR
jgi:hypothetical protein